MVLVRVLRSFGETSTIVDAIWIIYDCSEVTRKTSAK